MTTRALAAVFLLAAAGCGGAQTESTAASPSATAEASAAPASASKAADEEPAGVPDKCTQKGDICVPPSKFVKKLCDAGNADVALYFFRKGSPFTRAYLAKNVDAWNASGGASSNDKLAFDEEVIVLLERKAGGGGIQVSGATGSYDVLRWDGSCASLQSDEITFNVPPAPKHTKVDFHALTDTTQDAILKDEKIAKVNADRRKECKGVTMGDVSAKCAKLVDQLQELVVDYVRQGGDIPKPEFH